MEFTLRRDVVAGLVTLAIGIVVCWISLGYRIGTPARMGPGLVPLILGGTLVAAGLAAALTGLRNKEESSPLRVRPMIAVTLALVVFAVTVERLGFVPASVLLIFVSGMAESPVKWRTLAILSVILSPAAYFLFSVLLGIPVPAFAWSLT